MNSHDEATRLGHVFMIEIIIFSEINNISCITREHILPNPTIYGRVTVAHEFVQSISNPFFPLPTLPNVFGTAYTPRDIIRNR